MTSYLDCPSDPHPIEFDDPAHATYALAEAWASIDGAIDLFLKERESPFAPDAEDTGTYLGYLTEASEMIKRLDKRGFKIIRVQT